MLWGGGGPQVNKFEQVSSDDHQMSLVGGGAGAGARLVSCLISRGGCQGQDHGILYSKVQYIIHG